MRRLALLSLVLGAVLVPGAAAAPPPDASVYVDTLQTEHFLFHFHGAQQPLAADWTLRQWVGDLAMHAERAYETYAAWGYPAPLDDGDGLIDVWIGDLTTIDPDIAGLASPLGGGNSAPGEILINAPEVREDTSRDPHVIAHEVFHVFQFALYAPAPGWMRESTAEWATYRLLEHPRDTWFAPHEPDDSVDCRGTSCGLTGYEAGGYSRWTFWQYLGERFGQHVVKEIWDDVVAHADPAYDGDDAMAAVIAGKGTTLGDVVNDYALALLRGDFQAASLKGLLPHADAAIQTTAFDASMVPLRLGVNRLATRYVQFVPPAQPADAPCRPATLTVTVTLPAGVGARPHLSWPATGTLTALSINGSTASAAMAWDTCSSESPAYLSLPNPSRTLDARTFVVGASVKVDPTRVASAKQPPAQVPVLGEVIAAPTGDTAPTISLYGPETLRVLSTARSLSLVLYSTGAGRLHASFGGVPLGSRKLRAGANRVSFRLPRPAARMVSARGGRLDLTSTSPRATGWGVRTSQKVAFTKPAKRAKTRRGGR